jgi:hypothetical protein
MYTVMRSLLFILIFPLLNGCARGGAWDNFTAEHIPNAGGFTSVKDRRLMSAQSHGVHKIPLSQGYHFDHKTLYQKHISERRPHSRNIKTTFFANGASLRTWSQFELGKPDFWQTLVTWDEVEHRFRPYRSLREYHNMNPPSGGP